MLAMLLVTKPFAKAGSTIGLQATSHPKLFRCCDVVLFPHEYKILQGSTIRECLTELIKSLEENNNLIDYACNILLSNVESIGNYIKDEVDRQISGLQSDKQDNLKIIEDTKKAIEDLENYG